MIFRSNSPALYRIVYRRWFASSSTQPVRIAVVGSGPAGFYVSSSIARRLGDSCNIDIFDKQPLPFGLIRYGVAPDHPEVKNCIHQFEQLVDRSDGRVRLFCNVAVGSDVTINELRDNYNAVVLAYGAENERRLGVKGESANNCHSGRSFVGWYNGSLQHRNLDVNLDTETAVIIGHGNVALDAARILLSSVDRLAHTDTCQLALDALAKSRIRRVLIVGRRGPMQISFTIKELRELINMTGCVAHIDAADFTDIRHDIDQLPRIRRRLMELMVSNAKDHQPQLSSPTDKYWQLLFRRSPIEVLTDDRQHVSGIRFAINQLSDNRSELATITNQLNIESIDCGLIIYSIGYQTIAMAGVPMRSHVIDTSDGCHVTGMDDVYASGWCARGPTGVLVSTQYEALTTANAVCNDIEEWRADGSLDVKESALALLINRRVPFITWQDWKHIDAEECRRGEMRGKPREKFTSIDEILDVVKRHRHGA